MSDKDLELLDANVREVMSTRAGKHFIWEVLAYCGIYTDNSAVGDLGIEGKRSVGLEIINMMNDADPKIYPKLMLENGENNG